MNPASTTSQATGIAPRKTLTIRIATAWILGLIALGLSGWMGELVAEKWDAGNQWRYGLQALLMSGILLPGIWWLRKNWDRRPFAGIGLTNTGNSLAHFGLGFGIILLPLLTIILFSEFFSWADIKIDLSGPMLSTILIAFLTVFFFEALPEEFLFRGYIYRNLNTRYRQWVAGFMVVVLFVLLPVLLVPLQKFVLGMEISVGGDSAISTNYLVIMFVFGCFTQYLRIQTGIIWTSVGFHAAFVFVNRIIGPDPGAFIQFTETTNVRAIQIVGFSTFFVVLLLVILYPRLSGKPVRWNGINAE